MEVSSSEVSSEVSSACSVENWLTSTCNDISAELLRLNKTGELKSDALRRKPRLLLVNTSAAGSFQAPVGCRLRKKKVSSDLGAFYIRKDHWG